MTDGDEDAPLKAPDRPSTRTGRVHFISAARSAMETVVDDEQERRCQLEIDRYYRAILSSSPDDFGRRDARDLLVHRSEIVDHWDDDERAADRALRSHIYRSGRPSYYGHGELSHIERQITRQEMEALDRWRDANASADRDPDLELDLAADADADDVDDREQDQEDR